MKKENEGGAGDSLIEKTPLERGEQRVAAKRDYSRSQFGPQSATLGYMRYLKDAYAPTDGLIGDLHEEVRPGRRCPQDFPILQVVSKSGVPQAIKADHGQGPRTRIWDLYVQPEDEIEQGQILFSYVGEGDWTSFEACLTAVGLNWPETDAVEIAALAAQQELVRLAAENPSTPILGAGSDNQEQIVELSRQIAQLEADRAESEARTVEMNRQMAVDSFDIEILAQRLRTKLEALDGAKVIHAAQVELIELFERIIPVLENSNEMPIGRQYPILEDVKRGHQIGDALNIFRVQLADLEEEERINGHSASLQTARDQIMRAMNDFMMQTTGPET